MLLAGLQMKAPSPLGYYEAGPTVDLGILALISRAAGWRGHYDQWNG
jgi:hypothetical protein